MTVYRLLLGAIVFFIVAHLAGLATMGTLLMPGIGPWDLVASEARALYIAEHPWRWRLGWVPWQASALSDIALSIALAVWAKTRGRFGWAVVAIVFNVVAMVPEQWAEARMITEQVDVARAVASDAATVAAHQRLEAELIFITGTYANTGYVITTAAWMLVARRPGPVDRRDAVGAALLVLFLLAGWFGTLAQAPGTAADQWFALASAANAVAFPALVLWSVVWSGGLGDIERRHRAIEEGFALRWPSGRPGAALSLLAGPHGVRDLIRAAVGWIPQPRLVSDVTDVVYLSYMVPVDRVRGWVDPAVQLDERDGKTPLSILVYRHGHFGPAFLGPLRRLLPSPVQSNWRVYAGGRTVVFWTNAVDSGLYCAGARLLSDGLPAHVWRSASLVRSGTTTTANLDPGDGSAPPLELEVTDAEASRLPGDFAAFGSYRDAVSYLVDQDAAERIHRATGLRSRSRIRIPIDPDVVRPVDVTVMTSATLEPIVVGCEPLAFVVPHVSFSTRGESRTRLAQERASHGGRRNPANQASASPS